MCVCVCVQLSPQMNLPQNREYGTRTSSQTFLVSYGSPRIQDIFSIIRQSENTG